MGSFSVPRISGFWGSRDRAGKSRDTERIPGIPGEFPGQRRSRRFLTPKTIWVKYSGFQRSQTQFLPSSEFRLRDRNPGKPSGENPGAPKATRGEPGPGLDPWIQTRSAPGEEEMRELTGNPWQGALGVPPSLPGLRFPEFPGTGTGGAVPVTSGDRAAPALPGVCFSCRESAVSPLSRAPGSAPERGGCGGPAPNPGSHRGLSPGATGPAAAAAPVPAQPLPELCGSSRYRRG